MSSLVPSTFIQHIHVTGDTTSLCGLSSEECRNAYTEWNPDRPMPSVTCSKCMEEAVRRSTLQASMPTIARLIQTLDAIQNDLIIAIENPLKWNRYVKVSLGRVRAAREALRREEKGE